MLLTTLTLKGFKKHREGTFVFTPGSNMIVGPNYSGKTSLMEAILIGMFGNAAGPDTAKDLISEDHKDFLIQLEFSTGIRVERSSKDSSIFRPGTDEPFARGHTAVNKAVVELLGLDRGTFMKVFASEQGSPEQLLNMEGAELQRFIEAVIGIEALDLVLKASNKRAATERDKAEALGYMVMPAEEASFTRSEITVLEQTIKTLRQEARDTETKLDTVSMKHTNKLLEVQRTASLNNALDHYASTKDLLDRQLAANPRMPIIEVYPLVAAQENASAVAALAASTVSEARSDNHAVTTYNSARKELVESLASLDSDCPSIHTSSWEEALPKLREDQGDLKDAQRERATLQREHDELQSSRLSSQEQLLAVGFIAPLHDLTSAEVRVSSLRTQCATLKQQLDTLRSALKDAVCPTCKRAFDEHDPAALQAEVDSLSTQFINADIECAQWEVELQRMQEHNALVQQKLQQKEELERRLREEYVVLEDRALSLANLPGADAMTLSLTQLGEEILELERKLQYALKHNAKVDADNTQRTYLQERLDRLVAPDVGSVDIEPLVAAQVEAEQLLTEAKTAVLMARRDNEEALAQNKKHDNIQKELSALVKPQGMFVELAPLQREATLLGKEVSDLQDHRRRLGDTLHQQSMVLAPLKTKLEQHEAASDKVKEHHALAEDCRYLSTLLANSRANFIDRAMCIVFSVTTEFAKLSTDGDIERVFLEDGIKFQEKGNPRKRGRKLASGAQKSIIGLGLKLGVASLVTSDFGALLLDEVSAAMDDEISMKVSMAMDSLCRQNITISHRKMDMAGNTIELGV